VPRVSSPPPARELYAAVNVATYASRSPIPLKHVAIKVKFIGEV
jgi:hypothetical protein